MKQPFLPYGRQNVTSEDIEAVVNVLRSDFLTQGPAVPEFERCIAETVSAKFAVAVNSATSALHIACEALELGPGDMLWTSPNSFVASSNCALYCRAKVDFVDIDAKTGNMCVDTLAEKLELAERNGTLPKIVVPVHLSGQSCDMQRIGQLSQKYGFSVIEDASHAIGGSYRGKPVGQGAYSDITVFSFHPVKIVTSGEGGAAATNDEKLARRMERLRSHGITRDPEEMTKAPDGPWYYQQIELGWNYRMTDIHAALGASQIDRVHSYVSRRNEIADRYDALFEGLPLQRPGRSENTYSAWHLYVVRVSETIRRSVFEKLRSNGIGVNLHYIPIHLQPYYHGLGFKVGDFPESEKYYREAISLPIFPIMSEADQNRVVDSLKLLL